MKPPASTLEFKNFDSILQKIFAIPDEKRLHPVGSSCAWAGLWPAVPRTLSTSQSFQTFLKHNVGNPGLVHKNCSNDYIDILLHLETPFFNKPSALTANASSKPTIKTTPYYFNNADTDSLHIDVGLTVDA